jgi:hypothetical protein
MRDCDSHDGSTAPASSELILRLKELTRSLLRLAAAELKDYNRIKSPRSS